MSDAEVKFTRLNSRDEAAFSQHENPTRTFKLPSERVVLLVLVSLLAAALIIICSLSVDKARDNQTLQTLKEENEALGRNLSELTCLKCEAGWELHGRHLYFFTNKRSSWTESRRSCMDLGGDLVKIDSREEQVFLEGKLRYMMVDNDDLFWVGLTDSGEEGRWLWVDGSPLDGSFPFWSDGQPDDKGVNDLPGADCARIGEKGGADRGCDYPQKSICEKAAGTVKVGV